jgi:hypothetical protein
MDGGAGWPSPLSGSLLPLLLWLALLGAGCGDASGRREDARVLAEFRGPQFIPVGYRRPSPAGPPLVPHVVYGADFNCLVCHAHRDFQFRGQWVPQCTHPERKACLQCHVPWQTQEQPFRFEMLGHGQRTSEATAPRPGPGARLAEPPPHPQQTPS